MEEQALEDYVLAAATGEDEPFLMRGLALGKNPFVDVDSRSFASDFWFPQEYVYEARNFARALYLFYWVARHAPLHFSVELPVLLPKNRRRALHELAVQLSNIVC